MDSRIKRYSDSTLRSMTKDWLINDIRILEDNWETALMFNDVQAEYIKYLYNNASDELKDKFIRFCNAYAKIKGDTYIVHK